MKYTIYNEEIERSQEKEVCLRVEIGVDGWATLIACNPHTGERIHCGSLLQLSPEGRLVLMRDIDPDLGFDLDADERIILDD